MARILLTCVFVVAGLITNAQNQKQWFALGDRALAEDDFLVAADCFERAYLLDSADFEATTRYADALRYVRNYSKAEFLYNKAFNKDKGKLFPPGQFYLAEMQKRNGKYKEALRNYKKFGKKQKRDKEGYLYRKCIQEIESCTFALNARRREGAITLSPILGDVNNDPSEFSPVLLDSTLFFTGENSETNFAELKKASLSSDSVFTLNKAYAPSWASLSSTGNLVFSPDGDRAYYVECQDSTCRIMESDVVEGRIQPGNSLPTINKTGVKNTTPWVATIGLEEVLLFASNRPGTEGGMDLWWSTRKSNGDWTPPANMGNIINSPDDEIAPFFLDGKLYFSSQWHTGFGGFDVFSAEGTHRRPGTPENLGYPINSSHNDIYYRYFSDSKFGMVSSNRDVSGNNTYCCADLYRIDYRDSLTKDVPDIFVSLAELNDYLPVTLYFHNDEPNPNTRDTTTTLSYDDCYNSYLSLKKQYTRENAKGLKGEAKEEAEFDVEDFYTFKVEKGRNDLDQFSDLLLAELEKGYSIELVIKGFASPRAESDYNVNLTRRRIASLINFLREEDDGVFLPYFEGKAENHATLSFVEVPFGEYEADQNVSDQLNDEQNSIYSRGARLERKIEIQSVQRGTPDSLYALPSFNQRVYDFGLIKSNQPLETTFILTNDGTDTLVIDSLMSPCGCTVPTLEADLLPPGEQTEIVVQFDPRGLNGLITRKVLLFIANKEEPYEISISAEVAD